MSLHLLIRELRSKGLVVKRVEVPELKFSSWHVAKRIAVKQRKRKVRTHDDY